MHCAARAHTTEKKQTDLLNAYRRIYVDGTRNLAKQALKKQSLKMSVREGLEESRKAEIVKEIMKKGKKKEDNTFQAEPEITTTVVKADN